MTELIDVKNVIKEMTLKETIVSESTKEGVKKLVVKIGVKEMDRSYVVYLNGFEGFISREIETAFEYYSTI